MSVVAVDIGSSRIKALLAGWDGGLRETRSRPTPTRSGADGSSGYPADAIHGEVMRLLAGLAHDHAGDAIDTIVFSCLGTAMVPVDADERPLGPALSPADARPMADPGRLERLSLPSRQLRTMTGSVPEVASFLLHDLWWRDRHPDVMARLHRFRSLRGYVLHQLTGADAEDASWASRTMLMELGRQDWSDTILVAAGLPRDPLPPIVPSTASWPVAPDVVADLGLAPCARVVVGGMDNCSSFLGATDPAEPGLALVVGTYEHVVGSGDLVVARQAADAADGVVHTFVLPERYISMTRRPIGLLLAQVAGATGVPLDELLEGVSARPVGQIMPLEEEAVGDAVRAGTPGTLIVQRLLEAAGAVAARFVAAWEAAGQPAGRIAVVGGGARQANVVQLKADLLGRPLSRLAHEEGSGIGALRLAAIAVRGASLEDACTLFPNPVERVWAPGA